MINVLHPESSPEFTVSVRVLQRNRTIGVYLYVCVYIYIYIYIYTHTHPHIYIKKAKIERFMVFILKN